jgi:hypothetical protein
MTAIGTIIWRLAQRFRTSGAVKGRPRSDRSKRLTPREVRYIRITADRDRFLSATRIVDRVWRATGILISAQAVHNKLQVCLFNSRGPYKGMELSVQHKRQRHAWVNQHMCRNWKTVLFSDESRFTLMLADGGRISVWGRPDGRFAEACAIPVWWW